MKRVWTRWRRPVVVVLGIAAIVTLLAHSQAGADVYSNVGPGSSSGEATDKYPLGHYELDHHFTAVSASITDGVNVDGVPALIAYFLANSLWMFTALMAKGILALFSFAFSLDLLNGSSATGGAGALAPVSRAIHSIYAHVLGPPWLVMAISVVSIWALWRALVQRRYIETAGALALSVVYFIVALAFVAQPARTIGEASQWTNEMSAAFLSITQTGTVGSVNQARESASNQLYGQLLFEPWAVLEFGGTEHCVKAGTGDADHDPLSVPVRPLPASVSKRLESATEVTTGGRICLNNVNKYAPRFLAYSAGSDERNAEYDALDAGDASKLPENEKEKGGYAVGVADKPATDAMEQGGQSERLMIAAVVFVGELGAFFLVGALSIGVIVSQVLALLVLSFSPVVLLFSVVPGRGHGLVQGWLIRLGTLLLRKAAYSLVLAVVLAVNAALASATSQMGWLMSWGLQGVFFWTVFFQRHRLAGTLTAATIGREDREPERFGRGLAYLYGARAGGRAARKGGRAVASGLGSTARGVRRVGRWVMPL
jgi:hypothetical protein